MFVNAKSGLCDSTRRCSARLLDPNIRFDLVFCLAPVIRHSKYTCLFRVFSICEYVYKSLFLVLLVSLSREALLPHVVRISPLTISKHAKVAWW